MGRAGIFPRTTALAALLHLSAFRFDEFTSVARVTDAAAYAALQALPDEWVHVDVIDEAAVKVYAVSDLGYAEIQAEVCGMTDLPEMQPLVDGTLPPVCLAAAQTLLRRIECGHVPNDAKAQCRVASNLEHAELAIRRIAVTTRILDAEAYRRELRIARARLRPLVHALLIA